MSRYSVTEHQKAGAMPAFLFSQLRFKVLAHMRMRGYSLLTEANNPEQTHEHHDQYYQD